MTDFKVYVSCLTQDNKLEKPQVITFENELVSSEQLFKALSDQLNLTESEYKIYVGLKSISANSNQDLRELGIQNGSKLYAIQKGGPAGELHSEENNAFEVKKAMSGLSMIIHNAHKRRKTKSIIAQMFEDPELISSLVASIDGILNDQFALDVISNMKLFGVMVNPKNADLIIEKHPCLASAFVVLWQSVVVSNHYSTFNMASSSDDMEVEDSLSYSDPDNQPSSSGNPSGNTRPTTSQNTGNVITSSQLANAIAQATNFSGQNSFPLFDSPQSSSAPADASNTPINNHSDAARRNRVQNPLITPNAFSQAMQQALVSTGLQQVTESLQNQNQQQISEEAMQVGLNQLRAMGITDDNASRQALTATLGNVEAAVNILFSGGNDN